MAVGYLDSQYLTNIADAIRTKAGTTATMSVSDMPTAISNIPTGGGGSVEEKDVNFYDYDGTVLYSYTLDEIHNLTELPELPTGPTGYTATSWTDSLADIKALTYCWNIGVNYTCSNDYISVFIEINNNYDKDITLELCNATHVDWGDGSSNNYTSETSTTHQYASYGTYEIKMQRSDGNILIRDYNPFIYPSIFENATSTTNAYRNRISFVKSIHLSSNVNFSSTGHNGVFCFYDLDYILIPNNMPAIASTVNWFNANTAFGVRHLSIPSDLSVAHQLNYSGVFTIASAISRYLQLENSNIEKYEDKRSGGIPTFAGNDRLKEVKLENKIIETSSFRISSRMVNYIDLSTCRTNYSSEGTTISVWFQNCYGLRIVKMPKTGTTIKLPTRFVRYSNFLERFYVSSIVTEINAGTFDSTNTTFRLYLESTTPPTLTGSFASTGTPSIIYVPTSAVSTYQSDTTWGQYSSIIQGWDPSTY